MRIRSLLAAVIAAAVLAMAGASATASPARHFNPGGCGWYGHVDTSTGMCLDQRPH